LVMFVKFSALESVGVILAIREIAIALIGASIILVFTMWPNGVTIENFKSIKNGMTAREVERVFGVAGMEYPVAGVRTQAWCASDGALATVRFDRNGRVERAYWFSSSETLFERWRDLLHRMLSIP
jgi:hypothetical protein